MAVISRLVITQLGVPGPPGEAVVVAAGSVATLSNNDDTGVTNWKYELLDTPLYSALSPGILSNGPIPTADFTPESGVYGCYRCKVTVTGPSGTASDIRNYATVTPNHGWIIPSFFAGANEMNFLGQIRGWMKFVNQIFLDLDASTITVGTENKQFLSWNHITHLWSLVRDFIAPKATSDGDVLEIGPDHSTATYNGRSIRIRGADTNEPGKDGGSTGLAGGEAGEGGRNGRVFLDDREGDISIWEYFVRTTAANQWAGWRYLSGPNKWQFKGDSGDIDVDGSWTDLPSTTLPIGALNQVLQSTGLAYDWRDDITLPKTIGDRVITLAPGTDVGEESGELIIRGAIGNIIAVIGDGGNARFVGGNSSVGNGGSAWIQGGTSTAVGKDGGHVGLKGGWGDARNGVVFVNNETVGDISKWPFFVHTNTAWQWAGLRFDAVARRWQWKADDTDIFDDDSWFYFPTGAVPDGTVQYQHLEWDGATWVTVDNLTLPAGTRTIRVAAPAADGTSLRIGTSNSGTYDAGDVWLQSGSSTAVSKRGGHSGLLAGQGGTGGRNGRCFVNADDTEDLSVWAFFVRTTAVNEWAGWRYLSGSNKWQFKGDSGDVDDDGSWTDLPILPSGTIYQHLQHNGTAWVAVDDLTFPAGASRLVKIADAAVGGRDLILEAGGTTLSGRGGNFWARGAAGAGGTGYCWYGQLNQSAADAYEWLAAYTSGTYQPGWRWNPVTGDLEGRTAANDWRPFLFSGGVVSTTTLWDQPLDPMYPGHPIPDGAIPVYSTDRRQWEPSDPSKSINTRIMTYDEYDVLAIMGDDVISSSNITGYSYPVTVRNSLAFATPVGATLGEQGFFTRCPRVSSTTCVGFLGGNALTLDPQKASISCWFRVRAPIASSRVNLFGYADASATIFGLQLNNTGFAAVMRTVAGSYSIATTAADLQILTGVWHLISVNYDGLFLRLYLDGAFVAKVAATGDIDWGSAGQWHWNAAGAGSAGDSFIGHFCDARGASKLRDSSYYEQMYRLAMMWPDPIGPMQLPVEGGVTPPSPEGLGTTAPDPSQYTPTNTPQTFRVEGTRPTRMVSFALIGSNGFGLV